MAPSREVLSIAIALSSLVAGVAALDNGLGLTPQMGYNTWNDFRCDNINAQNVLAVADKMSELGLDKHGYEYINIDDCWATTRDTNGALVPDPKAFPGGMSPVSAYIHAKGFKFGIYSDRGNKTCAGRPASRGHEEQDAKTFADWGVDYLKEDSCNAPSDHADAFEEYGLMRDALNKTGRHIFFSLCGWNSWYAERGFSLGNSWRISGDCNAWPSIYVAAQVNKALTAYAGPGGWNDADMLVGSNPSAAVHNSQDQARTQFSLWSVMASPLLIGSSMLNMSSFDLATYTNDDVIAISQDKLGRQGFVISDNCPSESLDELRSYDSRAGNPRASTPSCQQVWARELSDGSYGVVFVNWQGPATSVTCDNACLAQIGLDGEAFTAKDLWAGTSSTGNVTFTASVGADGASNTYRFTPTE